MRKIGIAAFLASVLVFSVASIGYAQSAEDLAKGQSVGVRYTNRFISDNGIPTVNVIYIRGDEIISACEEGASKGFSSTSRVATKRTEGNKLILDDGGGNEYIIDGYRLIQRPKSGIWGAGVVYTRE
jgi:hypothetical protein